MIHLILVLSLVGFLVWLLDTYIPMPDPVKRVIIVIVMVLMVLYLLTILGLDFPVPTVHR